MNIKGIEKLNQAVGEISWQDFKIVRNLNFSHIDGEASICMEMISDQRRPGLKVNIKFTGVSKLELEDFGGFETRISGFDIRDIRSSGWEGVSWEVLDFKEEQIHFFARSCRHKIVPQSQIHRICTIAKKDAAFFAYRVAKPRHLLRCKNAFSTK